MLDSFYRSRNLEQRLLDCPWAIWFWLDIETLLDLFWFSTWLLRFGFLHGCYPGLGGLFPYFLRMVKTKKRMVSQITPWSLWLNYQKYLVLVITLTFQDTWKRYNRTTDAIPILEFSLSVLISRWRSGFKTDVHEREEKEKVMYRNPDHHRHNLCITHHKYRLDKMPNNSQVNSVPKDLDRAPCIHYHQPV